MKQQSGNLFLVGLMGAGKSTVGRLLAARLGKTFIDSDHEIEARTGVKIPVIFEVEGEVGFRRREAELLDELTRRNNIVLATGGGAVLDAQTREYLRQRGVTIYLTASTHDLWTRTRHDRGRPLLRTANPRATLEELHRQRDPLYREVADLIVETGQPSVQKLATRIIELLQGHPGLQPSDNQPGCVPSNA